MDEVQEEIKELKDKLNKIERQYSFIRDYKLISAILNKLNVEELEIAGNELNNDIVYIVENDMEHNKVVVKRQ